MGARASSIKSNKISSKGESNKISSKGESNKISSKGESNKISIKNETNKGIKLDDLLWYDDYDDISVKVLYDNSATDKVPHTNSFVLESGTFTITTLPLNFKFDATVFYLVYMYKTNNTHLFTIKVGSNVEINSSNWKENNNMIVYDFIENLPLLSLEMMKVIMKKQSRTNAFAILLPRVNLSISELIQLQSLIALFERKRWSKLYKIDTHRVRVIYYVVHVVPSTVFEQVWRMEFRIYLSSVIGIEINDLVNIIVYYV